MTKRKIQILMAPHSEWHVFFEEFFEDTSAEVRIFHSAGSASREFESNQPDLLFYEAPLATPALLQKWSSWRVSKPSFRAYRIEAGSGGSPQAFIPDASFPAGISLVEFQQVWAKTLPFPETLHVLVADDEVVIGDMVRDFLSSQSQPSFRVDYVQNGAQALRFLSRKWPDVLVLDVKMPLVGGIEVFQTIKTYDRMLPVIIFFDSILGDEIERLHEIGRPAIIEKGSRQSEPLALLSLIKKMVFLG